MRNVERSLVAVERGRLPSGARALARVHDDLLFVRAFPRTLELAARAERALVRVAHAIGRLPAGQRALLEDSGIGGTRSRHTFEQAIAAWIASRDAGALEVDWPAVHDTGALDAVIRPLLSRGEEDAFDAGLVSTREWLAEAAGAFDGTSLAWLLRAAARSRAARGGFGAAYDAAAVPAVWDLRRDAASSTSHNMIGDAPRVARPVMRRPPHDAVLAILDPMPAIRLAAPAEAERVIDVARAALAARCREVYAISQANASEVWLADLGAGATVVVIGAAPGARLSLESNYGYLLAVNGVPVGYGGVTPLLDQANTGINVFPEFRGSEAAALWVQMLRAFHALFGVRRFVVNAVQFGDDNEEAIASGAYWFYDRLGFRPASPAVRALARAERARMAARPGYRTPPSRLRALARGDLHLTLPGFDAAAFFDERLLTGLSLALTRALAKEGSTDRHVAARRLADRLARALRVRPSRWPAGERDAFQRLAPVVALVPGVAAWPLVERRAVVSMLRAKGAPQERDFVRLAREHPRLLLALAAVGREALARR